MTATNFSALFANEFRGRKIYPSVAKRMEEDAAKRQAKALRTRHCPYCDRDVLPIAWPKDSSGGRPGRCADCMAIYRTPKPRKRASPEYKAGRQRALGNVTCEYVPQAQRNRIAADRRAARAATRHRAHVTAYEAHLAHLERSQLHDAHVRLYRSPREVFRRRYASDPVFAEKQRIRTKLRKKAKLHPKLDDMMRDAICRGGQSVMVEQVCGYTVRELAIHLEAQFMDGMDWAAFVRGEIHIDHRKPQATFDLSNPAGVRACWALSNLQPLWATDNQRKGAKWDG